MNWRNLGNATLVTFCLFAFMFLTCLACEHFPIASLVFIFVVVVALICHMMNKDDGDDNDRMSWFSNNEDEDEEEE